MDINDLFNKVNLDEDLANLGFVCQGKLADLKEYQNYYERLWRWTNKELQIDILTFDKGNTNCSVLYIKKTEDDWPLEDKSQLRKTLKNGLHLLIMPLGLDEWEFDLWEPDKNNPNDYGILYSGGKLSKEEYPEIEDAYICIRNDYDRK